MTKDSSNNLTSFQEFDTENLIFSNVRKTQRGSKSIYINYKYPNGNTSNLSFKSGNLRFPFGVSSWENGPSEPSERSNDNINISLEEEVHDCLKSIETKVIEYALENATSLFGESEEGYELRDIKKLFSSGIKKGKTEEYQPRLQCKLYKSGENYSGIKYFNDKNKEEKLTIENVKTLIPKGSKGRVVLQPSGIWIIGSKFGISYKIIQIKVYSSSDKLDKNVFEEDDEEEAGDSGDNKEKNYNNPTIIREEETDEEDF